MNQLVKFVLFGAVTCVFGILIGYVLSNQSSPTKQTEISTTVETKVPTLRLPEFEMHAAKIALGTLQPVEYSENVKARLFFNDLPVAGSEMLEANVGIFAIADWGSRAAFVISTSCNGSACGLSSYYILSVAKSATPTLIQIPDLYGNLDQSSISLVNGNLLLDFEFMNKLRTIAEFNGQFVKIHATSLQGAKLPENQCRWLFQTVLADCINPISSCDTSPSRGMPNREYGLIAQHLPGINTQEFAKLCLSACNSKQSGGYQQFRNMVCHP